MKDNYSQKLDHKFFNDLSINFACVLHGGAYFVKCTHTCTCIFANYTARGNQIYDIFFLFSGRKTRVELELSALVSCRDSFRGQQFKLVGSMLLGVHFIPFLFPYFTKLFALISSGLYKPGMSKLNLK